MEGFWHLAEPQLKSRDRKVDLRSWGPVIALAVHTNAEL